MESIIYLPFYQLVDINAVDGFLRLEHSCVDLLDARGAGANGIHREDVREHIRHQG